MFLRYMDKRKAVNLDNFDYICVNEEDGEHSVAAFRAGAETHTSYYGGYRSIERSRSSAEEHIIIKSFNTPEEADKFYESLEYAWINKTKPIFEID